jgi:hypothetical protein
MPRADNNTNVEFYIEAVPDPIASREHGGKVVYRDEEYCKISTVGDKDNNFVVRAHEQYLPNKAEGGFHTAASRYPDIYQAFKAGLDQSGNGTPLSHLPFLTKSNIAELKSANVKTVEMLAGMGDGNVDKGVGWRSLRDQARIWLDDADKNAATYKAQQLAASAKADRDEMAARLAEMEAKLAEMSEKRGPGRPRKED